MLLRRSVIAKASAAPTHNEGTTRRWQSRSNERVLRYPDGMERRICYPVADDETLEEEPTSPWSSLWWTEPTNHLKAAPEVAAPTREPSPIDLAPDAPSTPFPMTFNWADIRRQAAQLAERVRNSYKVLHGCPWPVPRPMFVLSVSMSWSVNQHQQFYTLRTRTAKGLDVVDELAHVLGSSSLAAALSLTDMQDGVVALNSREQAEWFAERLLNEGGDAYNDVHICEVPSHELFRLVVGEGKGCVVALGFAPHHHHHHHSSESPIQDTTPGTAAAANHTPHDEEGVMDADPSAMVAGVWLPSPLQLAHSLRGPSEWDMDYHNNNSNSGFM